MKTKNNFLLVLLVIFSRQVSIAQTTWKTVGTQEVLNGTPTSVKGHSTTSGALRINTGLGYVDMGPKNSKWCNVETDRGFFNFNKPLYVNNIISSPQGSGADLILATGFTDIIGNTPPDTRITIKQSTGYIGIGITAPGALLHVAKDNAAILLTRAVGSYGARILEDFTGGGLIKHQIKLSDNTTWKTFMQIGEGLASANAHLILQPTAGNVGIGTTVPNAPLVIRAADGNQVRVQSSNGSGGAGTSGIEFGNAQAPGGDNWNQMAFIQQVNYTMTLKTNSTGNIVLSPGGNVGIGTGSVIAAGYKLQVNGKILIGNDAPPAGTAPNDFQNYELAVDGNIVAKKVVVTTVNGTWPDYVFKKEYPLLKISEVEQYIADHGRLPGIPSASEVEKNGLDLEKMVKKQMEKTEEMMLYIIELKKENEQMKEELKKLSKNK